jgi:outer membrane lipoprotein-sorting protein
LTLLLFTNPEQEGQKIARALADKASGFGDQSLTIHMELHNAHGQQATRDIEVKMLEKKGDSLWSLITFSSPRDVSGTALLSQGEEQWLYLPAAKRVRRISSSNRSGPFAGSEFSYEDLTGDTSKYSWKLLGTIACDGGKQCWQLETRPLYQDSGYTRRVLLVETDTVRIQKIDFYDRKDALLKTLAYREYRTHHGKFDRAHLWEMKNHQNQKSTLLRFAEFKFNNGFSPGDFNQAKLK